MAEAASPRRLALVMLAVALACTDDPVEPVTAGVEIDLTVEGMPALDAVDGAYQVWVIDGEGTIESAGRIDDPGGSITVQAGIGVPEYIMITVERPGDDDGIPSLSRLLGGRFSPDGTAALATMGYLTPVGIPLETAPGVHVLDSTTPGVPADAGLWLVDPRVDSTHAGYYQTFTPLTRGWAYEGWVVRDRGSPDAVWLSYGQFLPNNIRKARFRDDTGLGPFSGYIDYERARSAEIHYPGDDWAGNPLALPVPGGLTPPLDLNGDAAAGVASRWTHVITIEPVYEDDGNRTEPAWQAQPFFLRPYDNAIGEAAPGEPRTIEFRPGALPHGSAHIRRPAG